MASDTTVRVQVRMAGALPSESSTKVAMSNPLINKSARDLLGEINKVLRSAGRPAVVQLRTTAGTVISFDTFASTLHGKVLEALTAVQVRVGITGSVARAPAPLPISKSLVHQSVSHRAEGSPSTSTRGKVSTTTTTTQSAGRRRSRDPSARGLEARSDGKVPLGAPEITALRMTPQDDLQPRDPYLRVVEANAARYINPTSAAHLIALFNTVPSLPRVHLFSNPQERSSSPSQDVLRATPSAVDVLTCARASLRPQIAECANELRTQFSAEERDVQEQLDKEERIRSQRSREQSAVRSSHTLMNLLPSARGASPRDSLRPHNIKWNTEATPRLDMSPRSRGQHLPLPPPSTIGNHTRSASPPLSSKVPNYVDPSLSIKRRQFADEWRKGYDERQRKVQELVEVEKSEMAKEARRIEAQEEEKRIIERAQLAAKQQQYEVHKAHVRAEKEGEERLAREVVVGEEEECRNGIASALGDVMDGYAQFITKQRTKRSIMEQGVARLHRGIVDSEDIAFANILNKEQNEKFLIADAQRQRKAIETVNKVTRDDVFVDFLHCHDEVVGEWEKGVVRFTRQMKEAETVVRIRDERREISTTNTTTQSSSRADRSPPRAQCRSFSPPLPAALRRRQEEDAERKEREDMERNRRKSAAAAEEEEDANNLVMLQSTQNDAPKAAEYFDEF